MSGTLPSEGLTPLGGEVELRAPLRLALSLRDGRVYVLLRDAVVAPGVRVLGLDLEVPDVDFPVELRGGVARYQHHKTRVVSAALVVEPAVLGASLGRRLPLEGPLAALSLHPEAGTLVSEARLTTGGASRARERARHVVLPGRGRTLRLLPVEVVRVGGLGVPADVVAQALNLIVAGAPGGRVLAPELDARGVLTIDALAATLWALLPPAGWKLPAHDSVGPARVYVATDGALVVVYGPDPQDVRLPPEDTVAARAALVAQAREDSLALADDPTHAASAVSAARRFATLRAALDARLGPPAILERALVLGAADPELAVDLADLVADVLSLDPGHAVALALRADLAEARGEHAAALADRARAAEAFERGGRARLAGFVHLAVAERAQGLERTQALEAALAVLGEDPEVLRALVEAHLAARRPTAVALAKRLARAASHPAERAWAHVAAGDVLRTVIGEPIAAKREYERALLVDPDEGAALEGLAQALITQGDPRRAAAILERLFARSMASGDKARAAVLSVSLGDLWLSLDAGAAVARWKRATELDPEHLPAIERLARAAAEVSDEAVALDAGERALALGRRALELMPAEVERALRLRAARLAARIPSRRAEALSHLEALLARTPDDDEALAELRVLAGGRASTLAAALGRACERCLVRGELDRAAGLLGEEAQAWGIGVGRVTALDEAARATLLARAEALLTQRPGDGVALDVVVALDPRPAVRVRALRARMMASSTPRERAQLAMLLARALADDGEPRAALDLAATAVAHGLPASTWLELAAALRETAVAADVPKLLARAAAHATPGEVLLLARAEAEAHEHAGDLAGAYEARTRAELGTFDELADVTRLAIRLDRHVEARGWLSRWEARLGDDREARLRWLAASADAALAAGDTDGEIAGLEQLLELLLQVRIGRGTGALGPTAATSASTAVEAHADAVATRLASRLELAGRSRALARLERRRATELGAPIVVAIARALAAAEAWARVGEDDEAVADLSRVLEWGASLPLASAQVGEALDALERLARRRGDVRRIVDALDRRARFVVGAEARARVRLEQAEVLAAAGAPAEALARLAQARTELPRSRSIAARLAREAKRQGLLELWAEAEAHLAALADDEGDRAAALEQHAVAADALAETGRTVEAARHDRVVVERGVLGDLPLERVQRSLRRLERHARTIRDDTLLDEVLDRWAELEPPVAAVERLYEKAELELARHGATERVVAALRRARARAEDDVPRARELDARIGEVLTQLERWDELAAHAVARGDRAEGPRRAAAYLEAARVLDERLGQSSAALERTRAALEADPTNPAGRALRRRLLRETARGVELAEALLEDARATAPGEEQASLRLEAADLLAPIEREGTPSSTAAVVRALEISRDVARGASRVAAPHRRVATYARLLARFDEEYVALGRLAEVTDDPVERALAVWRRVELARGPLEDPVGAQAELHEAIQAVEGLDPERAERLAEQLERMPSIVRPEDVPSPLDALLALGTALTAETRDHETHLRYLARQLERAPDARARADLHFRIGETREWKQGDGDAAERAYLAALRELPEHERSRKALRGLYLAVDRFGDLAEHLGIDELFSLWTELGQSFAGERQIAAGEALWPRLPRGSAERARVLLATADLYRTVRDEAEGAVMLLELVTREGPVEFEPAALERLRVLFLEEGRNDLYVEILRRQADRAEGDLARARALAEVGEALEWKLGDGAGAELEYRTALAVDPSCGLARERLGLLLASQDRFAELAADLGVDTLEREALALASRGRREGERLVRAADVLAEVLPAPRRAALWGELIEREPDPELRRKLMSYGPVSGLGRPAEAPPAWDEPSGATHIELPVVPREDADAEGARRPRLPVKLTVVADPLADVVRLVPRLHDVSSGGSAASLSAVSTESPVPAEVVPLNRDESVPPDFALVRHDDTATRVFAPTMLTPAGERSWEVSVERERPVDAARAEPGASRELGLVGEAGGARGLVGEPSEVRSARGADTLAGEVRESLGVPVGAAPPRAGDQAGEAWGVRGLVDEREPLEGEAAWDAVMARVPPEGAPLEVPSMIEDARGAEPSAAEVASMLAAVREAADEAEAERAEAEVLRASEVLLRASERARADAEEAHAGDGPAADADRRDRSEGSGEIVMHAAADALPAAADADATAPRYRRPAARSPDAWASWGPTDAARMPPLPARTSPTAALDQTSPAPSDEVGPDSGEAPSPPTPPTTSRWIGLARLAATGDTRAEALLRRGAGRWPLVREALVALGSSPARALVAAAWPEDVAGAPLVPLSAGPHAPAGWRRLAAEALAHPLSALLARAAAPVAAVLPPRGEDVTARQPLDAGSGLALALPALCRALDLELVAERDGAVRGVHLEPGEPPALIIGADVADDLRGTYLLARAAMRLRLGGLLADAPDVHAWVRTLLRLPEVQPGEDPAATLLRARLGPAGLVDLEAAVALLPRELERGAVEAWMSGTRRLAATFAAAWVGSPAPLLAEPEVDLPSLVQTWTSAALEQWIASVRSES